MTKHRRIIMRSGIIHVLVAMILVIGGFTVGIPKKEECKVNEDPNEGFLILEVIKVSGDDEVYTHTYNQWVIQIIVKNLDESLFTEIIVTTKLPAEIDCKNYEITKGDFHILREGKGKSGSKSINWSIGSLEASEEVTLTMTLFTNSNPAGHQEFTSPGEYSIIKGTSLMGNNPISGNKISLGPTEPLNVKAVDKEEPIAPDPPMEPVPEEPEQPVNPDQPVDPEQPPEETVTIPPKIDVLFLIDSTGSMSDEIQVVKAKIEEIIFEVQNGTPEPDVRYAIVTYRDRGDTYITKTFDFTKNVVDFKKFLWGIQARGGGDGPESVNEALHVAIHDCSWGGEEHVKMIFLIGDAPPHMDYEDDYDYRDDVKIANAKGIKVHVIGCSGINGYSDGVMIFKEIAEKTNGTYQELIYTTEGDSYKDYSYSTPSIISYDPLHYCNYSLSPKSTMDTIEIEDCDEYFLMEWDSGYSTGSIETVKSTSSGSAYYGSSYGNILDVQLTYIIQQEAISNGVNYDNAVSLPTP